MGSNIEEDGPRRATRIPDAGKVSPGRPTPKVEYQRKRRWWQIVAGWLLARVKAARAHSAAVAASTLIAAAIGGGVFALAESRANAREDRLRAEIVAVAREMSAAAPSTAEMSAVLAKLNRLDAGQAAGAQTIVEMRAAVAGLSEVVGAQDRRIADVVEWLANAPQAVTVEQVADRVNGAVSAAVDVMTARVDEAAVAARRSVDDARVARVAAEDAQRANDALAEMQRAADRAVLAAAADLAAVRADVDATAEELAAARNRAEQARLDLVAAQAATDQAVVALGDALATADAAEVSARQAADDATRAITDALALDIQAVNVRHWTGPVDMNNGRVPVPSGLDGRALVIVSYGSTCNQPPILGMWDWDGAEFVSAPIHEGGGPSADAVGPSITFGSGCPSGDTVITFDAGGFTVAGGDPLTQQGHITVIGVA